jgi:hypothetical protein
MEPETASGPRAACVSLHFQSLSFQSLDGINVLCQLLLLHRARAALTTHRSKGACVGLHSQSLFSPALNITIASWQLLQPNLDNGLTRRPLSLRLPSISYPSLDNISIFVAFQPKVMGLTLVHISPQTSVNL